MVIMSSIFEGLALTATTQGKTRVLRLTPKGQKAVPHVGSTIGLTSSQTSTKRDVHSATPTVRSLVRVRVLHIQRKAVKLMVIMSSVYQSLALTATTQGKTRVCGLKLKGQ